MSLALVTPPAVEPLTHAEIVVHLRLDSGNMEPVPDAPAMLLANVGAGNVDNGAHRYRVTFVTADGETDGGTISDAITVVDKTTNGKVAVSGIPRGGAAVTARSLYRTKAGLDAFLLVAAIADNATTTYLDNVADASLGAGLPTSNSTGDPQLSAFIQAARQHVEDKTNRRLITQTWRLTLDAFPWAGSPAFWVFDTQYHDRNLTYPSSDYPCFGEIRLPFPNIQSISSITYVDSTGSPATLPTGVYDLDADGFPGRVLLKHGQVWPTTQVQRNAVTITFVVGFGDTPASVPAPIRAAMKLLVGSWYETREAIVDARYAFETPFSVTTLLAPYCRQAMEMA